MIRPSPLTKVALAAAVAVLGLSACRTTLHPVQKDAEREEYRGERSCQVQPFEGAAELPVGSENLGWIYVPEAEGGDEATQEALAQKICEMGGDAYSQPSWVQETGMDKPHLKANAWLLPAKK